jgi:hypothetical protein
VEKLEINHVSCVRTISGTTNSRGRIVIMGVALPLAYKTENELRECTRVFAVDSPSMLKLSPL